MTGMAADDLQALERLIETASYIDRHMLFQNVEAHVRNALYLVAADQTAARAADQAIADGRRLASALDANGIFPETAAVASLRSQALSSARRFRNLVRQAPPSVEAEILHIG